jgi:hypothetical protein
VNPKIYLFAKEKIAGAIYAKKLWTGEKFWVDLKMIIG